jgi:hypothetical protein
MGSFLFGCINYTPTPMPTPTVTPSPEQMDKSPFTGAPCAAPCWHGLEVGKSTEQDAIAVLPSLTFIDQKSVQIIRRPSVPNYYTMVGGPGAEIVANCINSDKECVDLSIANDVLQKIIVGLNYEIRPDEAIGFLGNPDYTGYINLSSERPMCEVYLVWKSSRLVLATRFEDSVGFEKYCVVVREEGKVPASLQISEARFLSEPELNYELEIGAVSFFEYTGTISDK